MVQKVGGGARAQRANRSLRLCSFSSSIPIHPFSRLSSHFYQLQHSGAQQSSGCLSSAQWWNFRLCHLPPLQKTLGEAYSPSSCEIFRLNSLLNMQRAKRSLLPKGKKLQNVPLFSAENVVLQQRFWAGRIRRSRAL